jgi:hypothetical protein
MKALRSHRAGGLDPRDRGRSGTRGRPHEVRIAVRAYGIDVPVRGQVLGMIE